MSSTRSFLVLVAVVTAAISTTPANAQPARVSLDVRQVNVPAAKEKDDDKKGKKKNKVKVDVDAKKLEITLNTVSRTDFPDATVEWWFFGSKAGEQGLQILKEGTLSADIAGGTPVKLETEVVNTQYTAAHRDKEGERVEASGERLRGWGVRVKVNGEFLGERFSSLEGKALVEK